MTYREKVTERIHEAIDMGVCVDLFMDVLALLKEQEAKEQISDAIHETAKQFRQTIVRCKDCRYGQFCTDGETTYQCFKWNSNEFGALHEQDWFCADGKRKEGR